MTPARSGAAAARTPSPWLSLADVVRVTGGSLAAPAGPKAAAAFTEAAIDSRALQGGELFVPLPGANSDGHAFVGAALDAGAAGSLARAGWAVPDDVARRGKPVIAVADPLAALQALARHCRDRAEIPVVAVTGSNGKTTTKEMIAAVLGSRLRVHRNVGNLNNQIGLPLTMTRLRPEHQVMTLELAMRARGEIAELARICRPDVGVLTVAAEAHLERLGSLEAIAEAKSELAEAIPARGLLVLNADDARLWPMNRNRAVPIRSYAVDNAEADLRPTRVSVTAEGGTRFTLPDGTEFALSLLGRHNVRNALAAILVGDHFRIPRAQAAAALHAMPAPAHRLELLRAGGIAVLDDCYNANPASMGEALWLLGAIETTGARRAVLGDMLELGPDAESFHEAIGRRVPPAAWLYVAGAFAAATARGAAAAGVDAARIRRFEDVDAMAAAVRADATSGDLVLVKGSRGMRLERVVDALAPGRAGNSAALAAAGKE
ncbi:MAG TPA: UDP-N-acetylmuramoyl-tripeptide--D-alanyl-D-alanine ligase [Candidatus Eisenbacteria bacterium]|nr:UDP-N-acetylmuramoyl-tripeptide--D-alanyl-D-alanine ligase [Candidatus Eisenbacteria bacterium]